MASIATGTAADMRPVAPPIQIDNVYTPAQHAMLLDMIRNYGPWPMVTKGRFQNIEQIAASTSGRIQPNMSMDHFIVAQFRGWVASHGTSYYTELDDIFLDPRLRAHARAYWGAGLARPTFMYFSLSGPFEATDPGHIDGVTFRGIRKKKHRSGSCR
ncbi:hypothetical protein [Sphingobium tyrosinilyticum]|uniref:Uncharacterized protein n=1 Tax=Sphingobium tyrosinilyticum TaxID=2715436 RepID=A0ABV9EYS3_9SPHN